MTVKKMYLLLTIIILAFLTFQCGEEKNKYNTAQERDMQAENNTGIPKGNPAEGQEYFMQTCSACHGKDGKGLPNLGRDITASQFVEDKSDAELLAFLKEGRPASHPLNITGIAMPPKGGNPALTEEQLMDIVAYMRKIHQ